MPFGPRRGGPMCPPVDESCEEPCPGRHTGRPLQNLYLPPNRAGTEPRPYGSIVVSSRGAAVKDAGPCESSPTGSLRAGSPPRHPPQGPFSIVNSQFSPKAKRLPGVWSWAGAFSRIVLGDGLPENETAHGLAVEGNEGVEVAPPGDGLAGGKQDHAAEKPQPEAPEVKGRREQQQ